jgi:hypothetical protein
MKSPFFADLAWACYLPDGICQSAFCKHIHHDGWKAAKSITLLFTIFRYLILAIRIRDKVEQRGCERIWQKTWSYRRSSCVWRSASDDGRRRSCPATLRSAAATFHAYAA